MDLGILSLAARIVVAGAFLLAGSSKLRDLAGFRDGITAYRLVPPRLVPMVGLLVPVLELVIAVGLLLDLAPSWPALLAAALLAVFAVGIATAAFRGQDIPCHCFGPSEHHRVGVGALLRNVVLLSLALTIFRTDSSVEASSISAWPSAAQDLSALLSLTGTFTLVVMLVEPLAILATEVPAAWRRRPALAVAEAARSRRSCKTVSLAEGGT